MTEAAVDWNELGASPVAEFALGFDNPDRELSSSVALFEGDEGGLELAQRRALVAIVKHRGTVVAPPFAGANRIRFDGCDLSRLHGTPVHGA